MRWVAGVEYDGSHFAGWQRQKDASIRTVQRCVEDALSRIADQPVATKCAGRTDAGVHALGQVIHFDTPAVRSERSWVLGTNAQLPPDIALHWARSTDADFHARFTACGRRYRYLIFNASARSALWAGRCAYMPAPLDVGLMQAAADRLLGEHDFSSFRGKDCQARTPVKLVRELRLSREGDWVILDIEASGFLHHMVRNFVGTLAMIGRGQREVDWIDDVLAARSRAAGGETAPAAGLYFMEASYPPPYCWPSPDRSWPPL